MSHAFCHSLPVKLLKNKLLYPFIWLMLLLPASVVAIESSPHFQRFTISQGLSQNTIKATLQDDRGYLWIATLDGLNRYDGYEFKTYRKDTTDPYSISDNQINALFLDNRGQLWVGTSNGLNRYDAKLDRFDRVTQISSSANYNGNNIRSIAQDSTGLLWLGTFAGLKSYDQDSNLIEHYSHSAQDPQSLSSNRLRVVYVDSTDQIWVGTETNGVDLFDHRTGVFIHLGQNGRLGKLSSERITDIIEDDQHQIWVATMFGLNRIDTKTQTVTHFNHDSANANSLAHNVVTTVYQDHQGQIYVGTLAGISLFRQNSDNFTHWRSMSSDHNSLSDNGVWSIDITTQGILWIGTNVGLNRYNMARQHFANFRHFAEDTQSISSNNVMAIIIDRQDRLWVGTAGGGLNRLDPGNTEFKHFTHQFGQPTSLADDRVFSLMEDQSGQIWVGTLGGLQVFNPTQQNFTTIKYSTLADEPGSNPSAVTSIVQMDNGDIWAGLFQDGLLHIDGTSHKISHFGGSSTNQKYPLNGKSVQHLLVEDQQFLWLGYQHNGVDRIDLKNGKVHHYSHQIDDPHSLSNNTVYRLFRDNQGQIWIGTEGGGVNLLDRKNNHFKRFQQPQGLASDTVYSILQDQQNDLWFATNRGLSRLNLTTEVFTNFDVNDGLQSNEFNVNAAFIDSKGLLYFGGVNGFNRFSPASLTTETNPAKIVFTELLLFNRAVAVQSNQNQDTDKFVLPTVIDKLDKLTLTDNENFFTLGFVAMPSISPEKIQYAYQLQGWDKDWIYTDAKNRRATYTNIPAGDYRLKVKSTDHRGHWNGSVKSLAINILPPMWQTWWAYVLYLLLASGVIILFVFLRSEYQRAEQQKQINQQLKQLNQLKDEFLANTSDELRAPLNGIIGLAESLIDGAAGQLPDKAKYNLSLMASSGKRLANLVNDILDFAKLNNASIELNNRPIDMHALVDVVLTLCQPLVSNKPLALLNQIPKNLPPANADEERVQQILHNLIGNAIKFTDKGHISVAGKINGGYLVIEVCDTGTGVASDKLHSIFQSANHTHSNQGREFGGSGLGLAVSKQLVELHGGEMQLESTLGEGSVFSFSLPMATTDAEVTNLSTKLSCQVPAEQLQHQEAVSSAATSDPTDDVEPRQFRILLVDDEPVNRQVLLNHLSAKNYQLVEAAGGQQALDLLEEYQHHGGFDLILLDVVMPRVSGYEVCKQVREVYSLNDLPIIFLTTRNQVSDMLQSFAVGANDYLRKPVTKHELLTRVDTHLKLLDINRNLELMVNQRTEALEHSNQRNDAIAKICNQISATLDLERLRDTAYSQIKELMDVHTFCIGFYQPELQRIEFSLVIEADQCLAPFYVSMHEKNRPAVWCIQNKKPLIINDYLEDHEKYFGKIEVPMMPLIGARVQSLVYWPLIVGENLIGVLSVQSYQKNAYNQQHWDMINTLANTTAFAVDNANAYREIEQKNRALVETQQQLIHSEKMASLGTLTAGVAHEINNPTNFVHVSAQNLEVDLARTEQFFVDLAGADADALILASFADQFRPLHEHLSTIQDGTERIKNIVQDLRLFTQLDAEAKKAVNIVQCLESTIHLVKTKYLEIADFVTDFRDEPIIQGYPSQLNQVFMNLIVNACDAIRDRSCEQRTQGQIMIVCEQQGKGVVIRFKDNGCGMTEQTKLKLFEPFYTTKSVGHGTGLGLSISYGIVQKHGGELQVESGEGQGTEFILTLPK